MCLTGFQCSSVLDPQGADRFFSFLLQIAASSFYFVLFYFLMIKKQIQFYVARKHKPETPFLGQLEATAIPSSPSGLRSCSRAPLPVCATLPGMEARLVRSDQAAPTCQL